MTNEWISVKDRLPETKDLFGHGYVNSEEVLIFDNGKVYCAFLQLYIKNNNLWRTKKGDWQFKAFGHSFYNTTHWMPLPEPPVTDN